MKQLLKRMLAAVLMCGCLCTANAGAAGGVNRTSMAIGGTMAYFEMGAGRTGEVTLAGGRLFRTQDAAAHRSSKASEGGKTVAASINGGYFDAYSGGATVYATVIQGGEVVNGGGDKPTLAFRADGTPLIDRVKIQTKVSFRNADESTVTAYSVNNYDANNSWYISFITPHYGRPITVGAGARIILIENSVITDIRYGGTLPALSWDTNALIINQSAWDNMTKYFTEPQIGNAAVRSTVYEPHSDSASEWSNIVNGVGAGPLLLKDGVNVCDQNADFTDPKQAPDYVSSRSFAAVMSNGQLVLGSASSASMRQIANYLKGLGAVDAMALDGGASTYLNIGGSTAHSAGRALSNVLHIVDYSSGALPQGAKPRDFDTPSGWAAETINSAVRAGLIPQELRSGYLKNITRKEFCQLIIPLLENKVSNLDSVIYQSGISYDAARAALTDTYDMSVIQCYQLGLVSGTGNNKFSPNNSLTREQAAKILMGVHQMISNSSSQPAGSTIFADHSSISGWAQSCVQYVVSNGLMNGTGNNKFSPQGLFTREQAISTLYRMM